MELYLAPLQGMTIAFQRNLYRQLFEGIDAYYAPFIATSPMRKATSGQFRDVLPENNQGTPIVPQLLGTDGVDFRYYAQVLSDMGHREVNWNIGCPFPRLTRKKRGSGILPHPEMIDDFLKEVCKDSNYLLTIKMRLGLSSADEGVKVMEVLNQYPVHKVILHARTGFQRYEGVVDLDAFERLYDLCDHELVYNGDIFTADDHDRIQKRFPKINSFMLGRGPLQNPFLPAEIKGILYSPEEKLRRFKAYYDAVYHHYASDITDLNILTGKMKEFWSYAAYSVDSDGAFLNRIFQCKTPEAYEEACSRMFDTLDFV